MPLYQHGTASAGLQAPHFYFTSFEDFARLACERLKQVASVTWLQTPATPRDLVPLVRLCLDQAVVDFAQEVEKGLRILLLEDVPEDAELILRELRDGGVAHFSKCVSAKAEFCTALSEFKPDLVLSDHNLPGFTGTEALSILRELYPDLPFILVTGALGEEVAVDTIKRGATDYILKHRLFQLVPAVLRAVREAGQRSQRRQAEELLKIQHQQLKTQSEELQRVQRQLEASYKRFARLYETAPIGYTSLSEAAIIVEINSTAARMLGRTRAQLVGTAFTQYVSGPDLTRFTEHLQECVKSHGLARTELALVLESGGAMGVELCTVRAQEPEPQAMLFQTTITDITERKQLEREVFESTANERRRIGHELHDGLGQYLAGIAFRAKALEQTLAAEALPQALEAKELAALVSNAIRQTRSLARGLDPIEVETIGLLAALQNLTTETEKFFDITCLFRCTEAALPVDPQTSLALYRIVQEAIHNAITHGEARRIEINLAIDNGRLCLRIQDDGIGFQVASLKQAGMGLRVMHYRARSIGATFNIRSQPEQGTQIECLLPFTACVPTASELANLQ